MKEVWLKIRDYDYEVSNSGKVRSLRTGRELKLTLNSNGYVRISLSNKGGRKQEYVHRLVAQYFIENPLKFNEVNHRDSNRSNNCITNLEWCNRKQNMSHAKSKNRAYIGEKNPSSKLNKVQVLEIRKSNLSYSKLSSIYGVHIQTIASIKQRKSWNHV